MSNPPASHLSNEVRQWVLESFDSRDTIQSVSPLYGGISSNIFRLEIRGQRGIQLVVLRQFTDQDWLRKEPDLVQHEAENLKRAAEVKVPTPELIAIDDTGSRCGVPSVLMTHLTGAVELKPQDFASWLHQLVETLALIHQIEAPTHPWNYFTYNDVTSLQSPAWSSLPLWHEALRLVRGPRPNVSERFIHRDYHPTNVLWHEHRVSGVVDWVNSCRGPQGIDVGHCRLNLALLYGVKAADDFLHAYQSLAGSSFAYDPYWDLLSIIEVLPGPPSVYQGWTALGVTNLTDAIVKERYESYLASVMRRW